MADNIPLLVVPPKADPVWVENIHKLNAFIQSVIRDNNKLNLNYNAASKVKVSDNDTTADTLDDKLVAGTGITLTENNNGKNESITISSIATHSGLTDMPSSSNTDHDVRYVTKVQTATPTTPTPYEGMRWYDTDAIANPSVSFVVVTDTYTVADEIELVVCNKATAFTVTIPTASGSGRKITVKNIGAGAVTVSKAADTIDGMASQVLTTWDSMSISDDAANTWVIL